MIEEQLQKIINLLEEILKREDYQTLYPPWEPCCPPYEPWWNEPWYMHHRTTTTDGTHIYTGPEVEAR